MSSTLSSVEQKVYKKVMASKKKVRRFGPVPS
jgi:hypothetical protein